MATSIFINGNEHALSSGLSVSLPTGSIPLKPITQAEYDALSEEEKNSETAWLVSDAEGEGGSSVVGGGSSDEVYSTEETRIGTWIDGKPLYRKVVFGNLPSNVTSSWETVYPKIDGKTVVRFESILEAYDILQPLPIVAIAANGSAQRCIMYYSNNTETMAGVSPGLSVSNTISGFVGMAFRCVLEYTKTTDT